MVWQALASAAISGIGGRLMGGGTERGADQAVAATDPASVYGPFGEAVWNEDDSAFRTALSPRLMAALEQLTGGRNRFADALTDDQFIGSEVERLRGIAAPRENRLRDQLRGTLFNQGRLGLGTPDNIAGAFANPELLALETSFAEADARRVDQARAEETRRLNAFLQLLGAEEGLATLPLQAAQVGIQARTPVGAAQGYLEAGRMRDDTNEAFFAGLSRSIGGLIGGGSGGGAVSADPAYSPYGWL